MKNHTSHCGKVALRTLEREHENIKRSRLIAQEVHDLSAFPRIPGNFVWSCHLLGCISVFDSLRKHSNV